MANPGRVQPGGFWQTKQASFSSQTQSLLRDMMKESKLTNFQQRTLEKSLRNHDTLPTKCGPTSSERRKLAPVRPPPSKVLNPRNYSSNVRTKEQIEATGAYARPDYKPRPGSLPVMRTDKDKERLANMMAYGQDMPPEVQQRTRRPRPRVEEPEDDTDRFSELEAEIKERQNFLRDMERLGQGDKYRTIINTEISGLVREMELYDKRKAQQLESMVREYEQIKAAKGSS